MAKPNKEVPLDEMTDEQVAAQKAENAQLERVSAADRGVQPDYIPVDFEDALKHLQETGEIVEFEGSPWHVVDKDELVGVPFIIMGWRVNKGDMGRFVSIMAVTKGQVNDGTGRMVDRVVINDGSTGILKQYDELTAIDKFTRGMLCPGGLRRSDYTFTDSDGVDRPAKTYYIA